MTKICNEGQPTNSQSAFRSILAERAAGGDSTLPGWSTGIIDPTNIHSLFANPPHWLFPLIGTD